MRAGFFGPALFCFAAFGTFGTPFYAVQAIERIAGAINLRLMGLNIRDGLALRHPLPKNAAVAG